MDIDDIVLKMGNFVTGVPLVADIADKFPSMVRQSSDETLL